jgi:hypothetical protein
MLGRQSSHCSLIIDGESDSIGFNDEESLTVPIITIMASELSKKHLTLSLCQNIVAIVEAGGGSWLDWLPVESRIIFVTSDLDWVRNYPRLQRLKNSLFFVVADQDDVCSDPEVHERSHFLSSRLRRTSLASANDAMGSHDAVGTTDFEGIAFRAVAFNFPPFSVLDPENNQYDGYELNIVDAITGALNLNLMVNTPTMGGMWGWEEPDGNFTGVFEFT